VPVGARVKALSPSGNEREGRLSAHPVPLRGEGWLVETKWVYRRYREMGLQFRNKTPKRRVKAKLSQGRLSATQANETWAMDFVKISLRPVASCACSQLSKRS
jgi:hypothetical protein